MDKAILQNCRKTIKGLGIDWIDYNNAYEMVSHLWLKEAMELVRLDSNIKRLLFDSMENWRNILKENNQILWEVNSKRGIVSWKELLFPNYFLSL